MQRIRYTEEFKAEAIKQITERGHVLLRQPVTPVLHDLFASVGFFIRAAVPVLLDGHHGLQAG